MWFADLAPWTYSHIQGNLIAVGWLEGNKEFVTGPTDRIVYERLLDFRKSPWQPFTMMGIYECSICQFVGEANGVANLFIPANDAIYVCPELIVHYMNAHRYAPPKEFCDAVIACPPM